MQRKERMQSQKNGHSKIEQKNRVGKTATDIFNTKEQYLLATNADNNISLQQRAI